MDIGPIRYWTKWILDQMGIRPNRPSNGLRPNGLGPNGLVIGPIGLRPNGNKPLTRGRVSRQSKRVSGGGCNLFQFFDYLSRHVEKYRHTMKLKLTEHV